MKRGAIFDHAILILGVLFLITPLWMAFASSTYTAQEIARDGMRFTLGDNFIGTWGDLLGGTGSMFVESEGKAGEVTSVSALTMLKNSLILGLGFAVGKIAISMLAAYAIVYFRFPAGPFLFWMIFSSLLLPLEVRIIPSYEIVAQLGLVNTYTGLILPLIASATATFFFRQFYKQIPEEMIEAARLDNAGPIRFFIDILFPLSKTMIAAIFIIMFVVGWNQYLWPILMTTSDDFNTLLMGIKNIIYIMDDGKTPAHNQAFALAVLSVIPPVLIVVLFQSWFVKGLTESDK
jgi:sn-glycerol 3-phosphate transport system permease protein